MNTTLHSFTSRLGIPHGCHVGGAMKFAISGVENAPNNRHIANFPSYILYVM